MAEVHPQWRFKGRGAVTNPTGRFEHQATIAFDDGWGSVEQGAPASLETILRPETSRSIISTNDSPDVPFDRSINPYQGCEHGCTYCYARPSHAYWNLSPGLDFETQIFYKPDAPRLLEEALRKSGYQAQPLVIGANTDPYQPAERTLELTRRILEVLLAFKHPVGIISKSSLMLRDLDILGRLASEGLVRVFLSINSLDPQVARKMEPRAASPERRLVAVEGLARAGVPVGVMTAPMILGLNDRDMEAILEEAAARGADAAGYTLVRLPHEVKDTFVNWLRDAFPEAAPRVLNYLRESRGGALNVAKFGERMRGSGPYADLLNRRFEVACRRLGLNRRGFKLDTAKFRPPPRAGDQLSLF